MIDTVNTSLAVAFQNVRSLRGNAQRGTIHSQSGARQIFITEDLMRGLQIAVEAETGRAAGFVLYGCGRTWGERIYKRWDREFQTLSVQPLNQRPFADFEVWLSSFFINSGWGSLELDFTHERDGVVICNVDHSFIASTIENTGDEPVCHLFAGVLAAFFSGASDTLLDAIEFECAGCGDAHCRFAISSATRIEAVRMAQYDGTRGKDLLGLLL
jgi:hypothetical protein